MADHESVNALARKLHHADQPAWMTPWAKDHRWSNLPRVRERWTNTAARILATPENTNA